MAGQPAPVLVTGRNREGIDLRQYTVLAVLLTLVACGDHQPPAQPGESAWKAQTDKIEQAKELEGMIGDISARQRQQIDQQAQ